MKTRWKAECDWEDSGMAWMCMRGNRIEHQWGRMTFNGGREDVRVEGVRGLGLENSQNG